MTAPITSPVESGGRPRRVSLIGAAMGGRLGIHLALDGRRDEATAAAAADRAASRTADRVRAWARLLTRFESTSDLMLLNDDPRDVVPVGPTLGRVLAWGLEAGRLTGGIVDVGLLDERLAAESGSPAAGPARLERRAGRPAWSIVAAGGRPVVVRPPGLRFDLDGVAKGWLADRALALLGRYPGALVDADGDLAIRVGPGDRWQIGIADPTQAGMDLAVLELRANAGIPAMFGLATSGVSVHRWQVNGRAGHHLIDPRTGRPAETDVVQATVLAATAREAEVLAKTAVILGSVAGLDFLDRSGVAGAVVLTAHGERLALPQTLRWLA